MPAASVTWIVDPMKAVDALFGLVVVVGVCVMVLVRRKWYVCEIIRRNQQLRPSYNGESHAKFYEWFMILICSAVIALTLYYSLIG
jgi:hypothetical protein